MDYVTGGEAIVKVLNGEWESAKNTISGESLILNTKYKAQKIGDSVYPFVILVDILGNYVTEPVLDRNFIRPVWKGQPSSSPFTLIPQHEFYHLFENGNKGYEFKYNPESPDIYRIKLEWCGPRQRRELTVRKMTSGGLILQKVRVCMFRVPWRNAEIRLDTLPPVL